MQWEHDEDEQMMIAVIALSADPEEPDATHELIVNVHAGFVGLLESWVFPEGDCQTAHEPCFLTKDDLPKLIEALQEASALVDAPSTVISL